MTLSLEALSQQLQTLLSDKIKTLKTALGEVTLELSPADLLEAMQVLRDHETLQFTQCIDICGVDYSTYQDNWQGARFAVVYHLLSIAHNQRLRVRVFCADDTFPLLDSVIRIWPSADWYEREAFDLYGIVFDGHPDLRRILTDYGFVGHPFRKDFPISGHVEMIYDEAQGRVVYQPVSIDPREVTPRIIREENYGG